MIDFETRKKQNSKIVRKNNAALYAGSPMYYYCRSCGAEMIEPESHSWPAPRYCSDCITEGRDKAVSPSPV